jgi:hypothetical protein
VIKQHKLPRPFASQPLALIEQQTRLNTGAITAVVKKETAAISKRLDQFVCTSQRPSHNIAPLSKRAFD